MVVRCIVAPMHRPTPRIGTPQPRTTALCTRAQPARPRRVVMAALDARKEENDGSESYMLAACCFAAAS
jgi:hypothetical protein